MNVSDYLAKGVLQSGQRALDYLFTHGSDLLSPYQDQLEANMVGYYKGTLNTINYVFGPNWEKELKKIADTVDRAGKTPSDLS